MPHWPNPTGTSREVAAAWISLYLCTSLAAEAKVERTKEVGDDFSDFRTFHFLVQIPNS